MEKENIWSAEEKKSEKGKRGKYLVRGGRDTVEGKGRKYFGEGKIVGQKEERIGSIVYFKFTFFSIQFTMFSRRQDGAESQKPRQRVSNADRKVFANPESFCNKFIIG